MARAGSEPFSWSRVLRRVLWVLVIMVHALGGLYALHWLFKGVSVTLMYDFGVYHRALVTAQTGGDPYASFNVGSSFMYHPAVLALVRVFTLAPSLRLTKVLWTLGSLCAWGASLLLALRLIRRAFPDRPRLPLLWMALLWFSFGPLLENLLNGQINAYLMLALLGFLWLLEQERDLWAGMVLATAIVIKTSPVLFVPWLLVQRRYRTVSGAALGFGVLSAGAALWLGIDVLTGYLDVVQRISDAVVLYDVNQSMVALLGRHMDDTAALHLIHRGLMLLVTGLILLGTLLMPATPAARFWSFSALLVASVMFSPLIWYHHTMLLLLPLTGLLIARGPGWALLSVVVWALLQNVRWLEDHVLHEGVALAAHSLLLIMLLAALALAVWNAQRGQEKTNGTQMHAD